ncbi:hypothetical protein BKA80DRAFT_286918 [Phyllosticta citrichinensis]
METYFDVPSSRYPSLPTPLPCLHRIPACFPSRVIPVIHPFVHSFCFHPRNLLRLVHPQPPLNYSFTWSPHNPTPRFRPPNNLVWSPPRAMRQLVHARCHDQLCACCVTSRACDAAAAPALPMTATLSAHFLATVPTPHFACVKHASSVRACIYPPHRTSRRHSRDLHMPACMHACVGRRTLSCVERSATCTRIVPLAGEWLGVFGSACQKKRRREGAR